MALAHKIIQAVPKPIRNLVSPIKNRLIDKNSSELSFWASRLKIDKGVFSNAHYRRIMLAMAEEGDDSFLKGKIVADFGCGPRGSLVWAKAAALRIGIDVLADRYADEFTDNILSHEMVYLKSTEKIIPLPSNFVDVMYTLNAIDHVDSFPDVCGEIIRVMKPGGTFIGSFNLEEPASPNEPQQLNEKIIKRDLLNHLDIESYRATVPGPEDDQFAPFYSGKLHYKAGQLGFLWVRARKKP